MPRKKKHTPTGFEEYRPVLNRLIFGTALLGVLLTIHLGIQEQQGFVQGCTGFEASAAQEGSTFNCAAVLESGAAQFLGVSNVVWGFLFYVLVASLSFAVAFVRPSTRGRIKMARAALVGVGVLYSLYLVYYQFVNIGELCVLCLISAALVGLLLGLVATEYFTQPKRTPRRQEARDYKREAAVLLTSTVLVLVLAGADFIYFSQQGGPDAAALAEGGQSNVVAGDCYYDPEQEPVEDPSWLIANSDPYAGNGDAPVTVVEFLDPNCPACRAVHPAIMESLRQHGDRARFVFKPTPLWEHSVNQVAALLAAAQEGKFFDMLNAQYQNQRQGGLSNDDLRRIANEIGMDADQLIEDIESEVYRSRVLRQRQQFIAIGASGVPTILVNGRFVHLESRSPECMGAFIDAAAE